MKTQHYLKAMVLSILCIVIVIVRILEIRNDFKADEAQRAQHECKLDTTKCDPNAHCYGNDTSYDCICKFGWEGDGFVGDGHIGCQRRQLPKSRLIVYIMEIILLALVMLWVLVDAILACIKVIKIIHSQSQVAPIGQARPRREVVHRLAQEV